MSRGWPLLGRQPGAAGIVRKCAPVPPLPPPPPSLLCWVGLSSPARWPWRQFRKGMARLRMPTGAPAAEPSVARTGAPAVCPRTHLSTPLLTRPFWSSRPCLLTAWDLSLQSRRSVCPHPSQPDGVEFGKAGEASLVLSIDCPRGSDWTPGSGARWSWQGPPRESLGFLLCGVGIMLAWPSQGCSGASYPEGWRPTCLGCSLRPPH